MSNVERELTESLLETVDVLPIGKKNAMTLKELARRLGVDERTVSKRIKELRANGYAVVSMSSGGFFLPSPSNEEDVTEARRFIKMMKKQATERFRTMKVVKDWIERYDSPYQERIEM